MAEDTVDIVSCLLYRPIGILLAAFSKNGQNCRFGASFKNDRQSASAKWDICSYIFIVFLLNRSYVYYNVH